jgi:hypothetical protein
MRKQFKDLVFRDKVYCVRNIESGHEPMEMHNPFAIKEYLYFKTETLGVVGHTFHLNEVDEQKLKSIHSDVVLKNVQPGGACHETPDGVFCTTREEAEEVMKKMVIARINEHEEYIKSLRKEYYDLLRNP